MVPCMRVAKAIFFPQGRGEWKKHQLGDPLQSSKISPTQKGQSFVHFMQKTLKKRLAFSLHLSYIYIHFKRTQAAEHIEEMQHTCQKYALLPFTLNVFAVCKFISESNGSFLTTPPLPYTIDKFPGGINQHSIAEVSYTVYTNRNSFLLCNIPESRIKPLFSLCNLM